MEVPKTATKVILTIKVEKNGMFALEKQELYEDGTQRKNIICAFFETKELNIYLKAKNWLELIIDEKAMDNYLSCMRYDIGLKSMELKK